MSFRLKTILGVACIEIVLLAIFTASSLHFLKQANQQELDVRTDNTSQLFAALTKNALLSTDLDSLDTAMAHGLDAEDLEMDIAAFTRADLYDPSDQTQGVGFRVR